MQTPEQTQAFRLNEMRQELDEARAEYHKELLEHTCHFITTEERTRSPCEECIAFENFGGRRHVHECGCEEKTVKRTFCVDCDVIQTHIRMMKEDSKEILFGIIDEIEDDGMYYDDREEVLSIEDRFQYVKEYVEEIRGCKRMLSRKKALHPEKTEYSREELI